VTPAKPAAFAEKLPCRGVDGVSTGSDSDHYAQILPGRADIDRPAGLPRPRMQGIDYGDSGFRSRRPGHPPRSRPARPAGRAGMPRGEPRSKHRRRRLNHRRRRMHGQQPRQCCGSSGRPQSAAAESRAPLRSPDPRPEARCRIRRSPAHQTRRVTRSRPCLQLEDHPTRLIRPGSRRPDPAACSRPAKAPHR
jgi:hypothetical protein